MPRRPRPMPRRSMGMLARQRDGSVTRLRSPTRAGGRAHPNAYAVRPSAAHRRRSVGAMSTRDLTLEMSTRVLTLELHPIYNDGARKLRRREETRSVNRSTTGHLVADQPGSSLRQLLTQGCVALMVDVEEVRESGVSQRRGDRGHAMRVQQCGAQAFP